MSADTKLVEVVPGYCTTEAVAAYLSLSLQMVRRYRAALGGVSVNAGTLYPAAAVREFASVPRRKPGWEKGRPRPRKQPAAKT